MPENLDLLRESDDLSLNDLKYSNQGEKYSFEFRYLGKGIFLVRSRGYADDSAIKAQMNAGDTARTRLSKKYPGCPFHLIWDISEVRGASVIARYSMMRHAAAGKFASVCAVGANNLAKSYIRIISSLVPHLNFYFYKSIDDAYDETIKRIEKKNPARVKPGEISPETSSYASFIDLWQTNSGHMHIGPYKFKVLQPDAWKHVSPENNFNVSFSLIEGFVIYIRCEGFIKVYNIEKIYAILEEIMTRFGYVNSGNKFYTILDLRKVKGISLNARKQTNYYEELYKERAHMVIMIPSPVLRFALKVQKKINMGSFGHWTESDSLEEAVNLIMQHRQGEFSIKNKDNTIRTEPLIIPDTKEEMAVMIKKLHVDNQQLKKNQQEHIQHILEIMGRMTWDESFTSHLSFPDDYGPFTDLYNALAIVQDDFKEIIREKLAHAQNLQESEAKYWNLINLASDIIAVFQDGTCKLVNSRVTDVMGYTPDEAKNILPSDFLPADEYNKLKEMLENTGESTRYFETRIIHKKGHIVPVSVSVGVITYEKKPARMYIVRDITSQKIAEAELLQYRNKLEAMVAERTRQLEKEVLDRESAEKSDRLKSAFLSNMSHEIRTPMNAIIAFSNFLRNPDIPQHQRNEYINYIQSSGESLLNLINDIIDISKIEAKQINIQKVNCAIDPILEELYTLFEDTRKNKGCTGLQIELIKKSENRNLIIHTDPYRLKQILSNLLHNALKFTEKGTIEFGYEITGDRIEFYVKDTGIGIPADKMDFIFKRFGKLETSGKNKGGTGLGLAISQNLAKLLDGHLSVTSEFGKGSTFYLSIPFSQENQTTETIQVKEYPEKTFYNWENKKVIIAEDEDLNFKVLQIALQNTKIDILRAVNGKEAVEAVLLNPDVHIVLMDIQMPVMDGYEAMTKIKQINYQIPVIAQTAFAMIEEKESCLRIGFNDYISKPVKIPELLRKIDHLIL